MKRPSAFTLIELLAASALAAVLMVVLFQVIGSLGRTRAALAAVQADHEPWKADLLDTLRRDLANATAVRLGAGRIEITGHGALRRFGGSLAPSHEPVTIVYELIGGGGGGASSHFVRRQSARGGSTSDRGWSELVCANVVEFSLEPVSAGRGSLAPVDRLASPLRIRIRGPAGPLVDEVIVTR